MAAIIKHMKQTRSMLRVCHNDQSETVNVNVNNVFIVDSCCSSMLKAQIRYIYKTFHVRLNSV